MILKTPLKLTAFGATLALGAALTVGSQVVAQSPPEGMAAQQQKMQQMMQMYKPELRQKVMQLSPQIKQQVLQILGQHTRHSDQVSFRQVMHEVLADYQTAAAGIATDNAEMAAEAARRLANHRIPKGGLFPYFPLDKINDSDMGVLPAMNTAVEGSAIKLAEAAERGDMVEAAKRLSDVMTGCVACHQKFRSQPGASNLLLVPGQARQ
ncbi:MAG TPA: hypothetical protein VK971_14000 [Thiohalobacter sp.]|nr:hypothetical protein [Thiohalobacter sp.]